MCIKKPPYYSTLQALVVRTLVLVTLIDTVTGVFVSMNTEMTFNGHVAVYVYIPETLSSRGSKYQNKWVSSPTRSTTH